MIHLLTLNELYNINHTGYSESASKLVNIVKEFDFLKAYEEIDEYLLEYREDNWSVSFQLSIFDNRNNSLLV